MPKLHKYTKKSGYYVRDRAASLSTLQITPEGVDRLRLSGYNVGEKFPKTLLNQLKTEGLVYTHGEEPASPLPIVTALHSDTQPSTTSTVILAIRVDDQSWNLALIFPELPDDWTHRVADLTKALSQWHIHVAGCARLPAMRFWPGKGGAVVFVSPQRDSYDLKLEGPWPAQWPVATWLNSVSGLKESGNFFDGESGIRLPSGATLEAGGTYFFVVAQAHAKMIPFPSSIRDEDLGKYDNWRAWEVHLPDTPHDEVRTWCERLGYCLVTPQWRAVLVGPPPHRYTPEGLPVVPAGCNVIIALIPSKQPGETQPVFYTSQIDLPGLYQIEPAIGSANVQVTPLKLMVERRPPLNANTLRQNPAALTVLMDWKAYSRPLHAWRDGKGPHPIVLPSVCRRHPPQLSINCAAPLKVTWAIGEERRQYEQLSAEEASVRIATVLQDMSCSKKILHVSIDGGVFGALDLQISFTSDNPELRPMLPFHVQRRARWLSRVLSGAAPAGAPSIPLSQPLRDILARLAEVPGCSGLRMVQAVPPSLLPHLRAMVRQVLDNEVNNDA
jgi:hypothetical protein